MLESKTTRAQKLEEASSLIDDLLSKIMKPHSLGVQQACKEARAAAHRLYEYLERTI